MEKIFYALFVSLCILNLNAQAATLNYDSENNNLLTDGEGSTSFDNCVLIEEFAGQKCINCPKANDEIVNIISKYGEDKVVAVTIHSGPFGVSKPTTVYPVALTTDFTQQYWDYWFDDIQGQPVAKINRGEKTENYGNWTNEVELDLQYPAKACLNTLCGYNEQTRELNVSCAGEFEENGSYKLQLWLVEDSIVATQKMPDGSTNKEYIHNHILRSAINGTWGSEITLSGLKFDSSFIYTLPEEYIAENCSVVAFIFDSITEKVLNTNKSKLEKYDPSLKIESNRDDFNMIKNNNKLYNLSGQRVDGNKLEILIKNGKKIIN